MSRGLQYLRYTCAFVTWPQITAVNYHNFAAPRVPFLSCESIYSSYYMATTGTKNVDRHSASTSQTEGDDDDPYICGLTHSKHHSKELSSIPSENANVDVNYLDSALIDQNTSSAPNIALNLDHYVLGKTSVATDTAKGSLFKSGSAINILKGVANGPNGAHGNNKSHGKLPVSLAHSPFMVGSPGSLTWASSSSDEESAKPKKLYPDIPMTKACADEVYGLPIKRMIKQVCVAGLKSGGRHKKPFCLSSTEIIDICRLSIVQFMQEPSLLRLSGDVKVVGDIHGQFHDLMRIFKRTGMPPNQHYLFLGDYVDRGKQSLETICLLLLLKLRYPNHVHLLRGNHESASVTKVYGFYDECKRRSTIKAWKSVVDVFNTLPVSAIVNERVFCVHGGLSPSLNSFSQIESVQRPTDIPDYGLMTDLLWSDPDPQVVEWSENDRGISYCFGPRSLKRFCKKLKIDLVVRGHMVVEDGYEFFDDKRLVTVFSAPNYCGDFDNCGAVMNIGSDLACSFEIFEPMSKSSSSKPREASSKSEPTPAQRNALTT